MSHRLLPVALPLAAVMLFVALPAQAVVTATIGTTSLSQPTTVSLAGASSTASASQAPGSLFASAEGSIANGFTSLRTETRAAAGIDYTVVGLANHAPVTFHWLATGSRTWNVDNASFGGGVGVGIFNKTGDAYIHNVAWSISYVDGPVPMGDFAGSLTAFITLPPGGAAGNFGNFSLSAPASAWNGIGSATFSTTWALTAGWTGTLSYSAHFGISGDVQATQGIRLLSATVPDASWLSGPQAYLLLDDGSHLNISAAVPEPGQWALLVGGLLLLAARRVRGRRA